MKDYEIVTCPTCDGTGEAPSYENTDTCSRCGGEGRVAIRS